MADRRRAYGLITLFGIVAIAPLVLGSARANDSHWINIVWADQFTAALRSGQIWPRWLPGSHGGLGAPVFYFYGPVAFWLAGLFGLAGASVWHSLALAAMAALIASGLMMHRYLEHDADRPLAGALVYMLAPYHLLDFAQRGALAEFVAFAWLPAIAIGVRRAAAGRPLVLALSYTGLITTHLPTTVLATVFLLPLLGAVEAKGAPVGWARIGTGIGGGIALAAPYWLPALTLQSVTAMETMRNIPAYQPWAWSILTLRLDEPPGLLLIHAIAAGVIVMALLALPKRRAGIIWQVFAVLTALLALGIIPSLWRLPGLDRVQFPWRILSLGEFALALVIAHLPPQSWRTWAAGLPLAGLSLLLMASATAPQSVALKGLLHHHPDVIEYLPRGVGEAKGTHSLWALHLARATPPETFDGTWTTVRRFDFPAWRARCGDRLLETVPHPSTGLLRYRGKSCTIEQTMPLSERIGWALALATVALAALVGRRSIASRQHIARGIAR